MSYYSPHKNYPALSGINAGRSYSGPVYAPPPVYTPQPAYYDRYDRQPRRGEQWSEFIPVEQRYTEMIPETRVDYRPIEKSYTDYIEVKHETDYVPVPRLEKRVEYIPVDRYDEHVDYVPVQNSYVTKTPAQGVPSGYQTQYQPQYQPQYQQPYESRYANYYGGNRRPLGGYSGYGYRYL